MITSSATGVAPSVANVGASTAVRYVYRFGAGAADGAAGNKGLLGCEGAKHAEMAALGLSVS